MGKLRFSRVALLTLIFLPAMVGSCVHAPDEADHDHSEPDGMVLRRDTVVLVEIDEQTVTGSLTVQRGQETANLTVVFIDHDGNDLTLDPTEVYVSVSVYDEAVAEWVQDTPGEFGGRLHGNAAGQTILSFSLVHGQVGSGHPDYISPNVTVTVTP